MWLRRTIPYPAGPGLPLEAPSKLSLMNSSGGGPGGGAALRGWRYRGSTSFHGGRWRPESDDG
jgi:hypothetical protein